MVLMGLMDQQVHQVQVDPQGLLDLQVQVDLRELQVQVDHQDQVGHPVHQDHLVHPVQVDLLGLLD
jgi:hypothetical protein